MGTWLGLDRGAGEWSWRETLYSRYSFGTAPFCLEGWLLICGYGIPAHRHFDGYL